MGNSRNFFVALCALGAMTRPIIAAPILDQSQPLYDATSGFLGYVQTFAQTFTVGISGQLSGVSVTMRSSGPVELRLLGTSAGVPTFTVLASALATPTSNDAPVYFDFTSNNFNVAVGDIFAIQPWTTESNGSAVASQIVANVGGYPYPWPAGPDPYTGGEYFFYDPGAGINQWTPFVDYLEGQDAFRADMTFSTFVTPVPEPSAMLLVASGLAGMALARRKKKR